MKLNSLILTCLTGCCGWMTLAAAAKLDFPSSWGCSQPYIPSPFITSNLHCSSQHMSANVQQQPLDSVIQQWIKQVHGNVTLSHVPHTPTHLHLSHIPWQQGLTAFLKAQRLTAHFEQGLLLVTPAPPQAHADTLIPHMQTTTFQLHHLNAVEISRQLNQHHGLLSTNGHADAEPQSNTLWVQDSPAALGVLTRYLSKADRPAQQIRIKATLFSIDDDYLHDMGLEFKPHVHMPSVAAHSLRQLALAVAHLSTASWLDAQLHALQQAGHGHILSNPTLTTANHRSAHIEIGDEIPYPQTNANGVTNVTFKKAVLSLDVTPEVADDGFITLHLRINQDKPNPTTINGATSIQTRSLSTAVHVQDHHTIVLGGLYENETEQSTTRVPLLGDIPLLGLLFRHHIQRERRHQILIFVTPDILS